MLVFAADSALGQERYPSRVIRIVTATPGSNHDWGARLVAQELTPRLGQRVIVENRGSIAVEHVAKEAAPDGYSLLFYGSFIWLQPYLAKVSWDPLTDLAPITLAISSPSVLVVHPSLPARSVKELIALARARPGELNYSAGGGGSTPHIAAEFFKYMANARIVRVNYKGSGPAMMGLFVGEVQLMFAALGPIMPHVQQGRVRALAVTTPRRSRLVPDLPAVAEALPGYEAESVIGLFAPRKTSPAIIKVLYQETVQGLKATDPQLLLNSGVEVVGNTPDEFSSFIKSEMTRMSQVIKSASFSN
ncbi:MAG TPA: tripartite tricarboxylate transporter substrate-binding protein [Burkholderiales bacterium]|nr:tripartite tricarboxylate transporter substrate-binding protein [Burkholderiales bacterium]